MRFREFFLNNENFELDQGLFYQKGVPLSSDFERVYVALRNSEGRFLEDELVRTLPSLPGQNPLRGEWLIRKRSADQLLRYLSKRNIRTLMEVGCGNGWLTHYLYRNLNIECCGIDVNETELRQATRLFSRQDLVTFVYGDVLSAAFDLCQVDVIVIASALQYFPDVDALFSRLLPRTTASGEIHIMDSPLYDNRDAAAAKERSMKHFRMSGQEDMTRHYHHHTWDSLRNFRYRLLYDPRSFVNRIGIQLVNASPFPWIRIRARND